MDGIICKHESWFPFGWIPLVGGNFETQREKKWNWKEVRRQQLRPVTKPRELLATERDHLAHMLARDPGGSRVRYLRGAT
jgi:hypothetical protein